jgi:biotin carboxyl carrier protein
MTTKLVRLPLEGDDEAVPVSVEPLEGRRYRVTVGERTLELEGWPVEGGVALRFGDRSIEVPVDVRSDRSVVHVDGARIDVALQSERIYQMQQALGVGAADAGKELRSPMTGKVVLVACAAGEEVDEGKTIVIIEAMKMENELRAEIAGTIASIHCQADDRVEGGAQLIVIDPAEG